MTADPFDKDKLLSELQQKDKLIAELQLEVKKLSALVNKLMERLAKYENPKNSGNSSLPPSHDFVRPLRTKSLREPSGKKAWRTTRPRRHNSSNDRKPGPGG